MGSSFLGGAGMGGSLFGAPLPVFGASCDDEAPEWPLAPCPAWWEPLWPAPEPESACEGTCGLPAAG